MGQKTQYSSSHRDMTLEQQGANYAFHMLLHHLCSVCLISQTKSNSPIQILAKKSRNNNEKPAQFHYTEL